MKLPKYFYFVVKTTLTGVELVDRSDCDVVEVVRCGECKHHIAYRCSNDMMLWTHRCKLGHGTLGDDWFCADGERKQEQ